MAEMRARTSGCVRMRRPAMVRSFSAEFSSAAGYAPRRAGTSLLARGAGGSGWCIQHSVFFEVDVTKGQTAAARGAQVTLQVR